VRALKPKISNVCGKKEEDALISFIFTMQTGNPRNEISTCLKKFKYSLKGGSTLEVYREVKSRVKYN